MLNITDEFVSYIMKLKNTSFSEDVIAKAKECVLDYLGCAYAGSKVNSSKFEQSNYSVGKCELLGYDIKTDARTAAFVNGFNAHTVELDDGNRFGMIHLGANIISALIAASQDKELGFDKIVLGTIIGYEIGVRISLAMQPGHKKRGYHTSGTAGTIASAVAVAVAMGCNEKQLKATISSAATSAAGLLEIQENSSELKPYNVGHAALSGINAAYIGMLGFESPDDILNGTRGMLKLLSDNQNLNELVKNNDYYEIQRIYVKPYAACRHCHSAIEAIIAIRNENNISIDDIDVIKVDTYALAINGHNHTDIKSVSSARLSIPFSVALAFIRGNAGLNDYILDTINDKDILSLTRKVVVCENKEFTNDAKSKRIAEVTLTTHDGKAYSKRVDYAKGDPENPMSREEIIDKFISLDEWSGHFDKKEIIKTIFD